MTQHHGIAPRDRGFTLIVTLILLVLISLVAAASMRGVALESKMSAAAYDRSIVYQAAESGLRQAEGLASTAAPTDFPANGCDASGRCAVPVAGATPRWLDSAFTAWMASTAAVSTQAPTPGYVIERNGDGENWLGCAQQVPRSPNCRTPRYRVTSMSTAAGRATVILQSDVATQ